MYTSIKIYITVVLCVLFIDAQHTTNQGQTESERNQRQTEQCAFQNYATAFDKLLSEFESAKNTLQEIKESAAISEQRSLDEVLNILLNSSKCPEEESLKEAQIELQRAQQKQLYRLSKQLGLVVQQDQVQREQQREQLRQDELKNQSCDMQHTRLEQVQQQNESCGIRLILQQLSNQSLQLDLIIQQQKQQQLDEMAREESQQLHVLQAAQRNQSRQIEELIKENEKLQEQQSKHHEQQYNQSLNLQLMIEQIGEQLHVQHNEQTSRYANLTQELNIVLLHHKEVIEEAKNEEQDYKLTSRSFLDEHNLVRVIPTSEHIRGITVLGREVFVVRGGLSYLNVYNYNTFNVTRTLAIPASSNLQAIVASPRYNCLYISDIGLDVIHQYNLSNNVITKWSVGGDCYGLSLTNTDNVLITLFNNKLIQEYTWDGVLIREISLDRSIEGPYHCVQLSTDHLVVSNRGSNHGVFIVNVNGSIIQSYGRSIGSDVGQFNTTGHLAVDRYDNVLVTDENNNRVVLLSPSLTHLGYITLIGHQLTKPFSLHLDKLNHRLYIGEWTQTGRVLVVDV